MKESSIQSNTIYNAIKSAAAIVFPLISFPYASRVLLTESMGKVSYGNSIVSYFTLIATLGITTYAVRECAKVRNNAEELSRTASQLYSINILTTVAAYVLLAATLLFARPLENYRFLIVMQSMTILFTTLGTEWLNTAMEDFRYITIRTVFFQVLAIVLLITFVHSPEDYLIYALINVVSASGSNIVNIFYRRKYCRIRFTTHMDLKKHMPPILLLFSMVLSQTIYVNSDVTIIGLFRGDHEVGLYNTAVKIYNIVNTMVSSVAFVVMPKLSMWFAQKNYKEINKLLRYGMNFIIVLGLPCIVGINVAAGGIVELIAGADYAAATPALHVLTIALAASLLSGFMGNLIMIPSGREKVCLKASICSAVVNLILNLIFIPRFGFVAAACTTAVAELVGCFMQLPKVEKEIQLGKIWTMVGAPLCGSAAIVVIGICVKALVKNVIMCTCLTICVSAVAYLAILIIMRHEFTLSFIRRRSK